MTVQKTTLLLKGGRVIDPSRNTDEVTERPGSRVMAA